jgi:hypothetical protein
VYKSEADSSVVSSMRKRKNEVLGPEPNLGCLNILYRGTSLEETHRMKNKE